MTDRARPADRATSASRSPRPRRRRRTRRPSTAWRSSRSTGPTALNALNFALIDELADALEALDRDPACRAIVLTGAGDRAFAAGADIQELADADPGHACASTDDFHGWERIGAIRTPLIAAVRGFALGGGCELAMACDMIVAGEDAQFGQPEIRLGVMPGAGGTQRLTRAIGKARAMEMVLTGRTMRRREARRTGS